MCVLNNPKPNYQPKPTQAATRAAQEEHQSAKRSLEVCCVCMRERERDRKREESERSVVCIYEREREREKER